MMYYIIYSSICKYTNKFIQNVIVSDTKERCLIALDAYTEASEDRKVFLVNEELIGDILIREFASVKRGYHHSLVLVNANSIVNAVKITKTKTK